MIQGKEYSLIFMRLIIFDTWAIIYEDLHRFERKIVFLIVYEQF